MQWKGSLSRVSAYAGLLGVLVASLSGCGGGGSPSSGTIITPPNFSGRAACQIKSRNAAHARWTVLVYLNAANDLQPDSLLNIAQMAKVGSDGTNLNIVVQWKQQSCPNNAFGCGTPSFEETRRYYIRQHSQADQNQINAGNTSVLDADILPMTSAYYNSTTKQTDMGDWRVLQDFVQWGASTYPADNLAVLIWNHGAGWEPTRAAKMKPTYRAVSLDYATGNEIATEQMPGALTGAAQPVDALIFDASLMQMAEVAYQVRNAASVMIGSEESPPGSGYPYDLWLADLKSSGSDACTMGQSIVNRFVNANTNQVNITQSVIDLSKMQNVANVMDAFGTSLTQHLPDQSSVIVSARESAQKYDYSEYKDLYDFSRLIIAQTTAADLKLAAQNMQQALTSTTNGAVLVSGHNAGRPNSYGLATTIYNPAYRPSIAPSYTLYSNLAIAQSGGAPHWAAFLQNQTQ